MIYFAVYLQTVQSAFSCVSLTSLPSLFNTNLQPSIKPFAINLRVR